jgi:hypothetical protein
MVRLAAFIGLAAGLVPGLAAQEPATVPLSFQGIQPGMTWHSVESVVANQGGTLQCQATREPRLHACTARLTVAGDVLIVTLSLVDSRVGIALVTARLPAERIARWHAELVNRYGERQPTRHPGQESFQWIHAGQMLRLTVRREAGGLTASVSLLDGALLDGLPPP